MAFMKNIGGSIGRMASKGMGVAQQAAAPNPYTLDAGLQGMLQSGIDQQAQSRAYGAQIPTLINQLGQAPVFGTAEQDIYNQQVATNNSIMRRAQLNVGNQLANQIGGFNSAMVGQGINVGGAYSASMAAGAQARGQASLNEVGMKQAQVLQDLRGSLLENVYNRLSNKTSALISQQAQSDSLASSNIGSVLNKQMFDRKLAADAAALQAQERMAKEQAKAIQKAGSQSAFTNILGGVFGMIGNIATGGMAGGLFSKK